MKIFFILTEEEIKLILFDPRQKSGKLLTLKIYQNLEETLN